jgi:exopolysaccharide biosynthesis polyprenyl glycosylphosphotransferase
MGNLRRRILLKALKFCDLVIMILSFVFASIATHFQKNNIPFDDFVNMRIKIHNFVLFLGFLSVWYFIFTFFQLYRSKRFSDRQQEIIDIVMASTVGTVFILVASFVFNISMITPIFLIVFLCTVSFFTIISRLALRYILGQLRVRGRNLRYMLIAGTNTRAIDFARKIESKPELGYQIIGFVDDNWDGLAAFQKSGYRLVTDLSHVSPYIRNHVVDEMAINLPMKSYYQHSEHLVAMCEEQGIIVRQFSDIFSLKNSHSEVDDIEDEAVITIRTGEMLEGQMVIKRALDILVSAVSLLFITPSFLLIAVLIKVTSKGPVFFAQNRVGLNKRIFRMYKFRTMGADAEQKQEELEELNEASGPVFKIRNDPRITRVGNFLRKTSIDELPQLVNILKGEMSLVGPRPLPLRDYKGFKEDWHRRRVSVKPGVTCLWQINGRSDISFEKWMELDIEYIDHWSLWFDLKILLKTIPIVLKGSGAV